MSIKCFVLDLDGVVYRGKKLVPNADERIENLRNKGKVLFLTNNSTLTRAGCVEKLEGLGIPAEEEEIITSGYASALYIKENYPKPRVFVIGEEGLKNELETQGIKTGVSRCSAVLVGLDRNLNYTKIATAMKLIRSGASFLATNLDNALVTEDGLLPGAGSIVSAVRTACEKEPVVIGKPSHIMADIILGKAKFAPQEILLIGDRLETDIVMGKKAGMKTALVLTGYAKQEDVDRSEIKPDYVLESL
ncbi:MAG: HAD-IIA family hydrolase [Candidatus Hydrothermarchaeota archaeon]|nr:HAD-IIA family hydrolase [Candidatus Hydrothermarchaeota archaeon]